MRLETVKKATGEKIKTRRLALDISQDALTRQVALSRASIANIERGLQAISIYQLFLFAKALNTTPDKLLPEFTDDPISKLSDDERSLADDLIRKVQHA